jgi:hypothetical protein
MTDLIESRWPDVESPPRKALIWPDRVKRTVGAAPAPCTDAIAGHVASTRSFTAGLTDG